MTHSSHQIEEYPVNYSRFPKLTDWTFPECEHGLSADLCSGPDHY